MKPSVRSVLTDTGTSMVMIYSKDLKLIHEMLCKHIEDNMGESGAKCSKIGYGYLQIDKCSEEIQSQLPSI